LEGFAILRAIPSIGMIILDNQMPYIDGLVFLRKLRATPPFDNLPVLISTADEKTEVFIAAGANKVMTKPYNVLELNQFIDSVRR